ncbi:hypothetical protein KI387_033589 [Taxus chinensis]|uniref:Uncharacterized protein n=1 Tax=Taxus chinensis TaxID=29808 RepID=A0AA38BV12_TAXCH|nr:hypothetical protein KI387_033589 [Taxus chinensis]
MERYKVATARRFHKRIAGHKFETAVEEVKKYEWRIRSCYHKYLDYKEDALAWLMALDASFLLECLEFYSVKHNQADEASSQVKQLGRVLDPSGRSATHNAIKRDLMMLENQVPLFLLQKLLEMESGCGEKAEKMFRNLVTLACEELSPFMFKMCESSRLRIHERGHLLEALYYSLVPAPRHIDDTNPKAEEQVAPPNTRALESLWEVLSSLNVVPVRRLTALLSALKGSLTLLFGFSDAQKDDNHGVTPRKQRRHAHDDDDDNDDEELAFTNLRPKM